MWRLVGNGRITLDPEKRLPMYQKLKKLLMDELLEVPLISVTKFYVVNTKLKNIYVAFTRLQPRPPRRVDRRSGRLGGGGPGRRGPPPLPSLMHRFLAPPLLLDARRRSSRMSILIFLMVRLLPGNIIDLCSAATTRRRRSRRSRPRSSSA